MKLEIELVPETVWYSNLRKLASKKEWDEIRKEVYVKANHKCEICGASGKLNCHEIWEYDDKNNIQHLKGFQALCDNCHNIKHIGFVNVQISKGMWPKKVLEDLAKHFMKVNNVSPNEFDHHIKEAFDIWRERSKKEWKTDFGEFDKKLG